MRPPGGAELRPSAATGLRVLVAAMLLAAGIGKLVDPPAVSRVLPSFVPPDVGAVLLRIVSALEIGVGAALLLPARRLALVQAATAGLSILFLATTVVMAADDAFLDNCGCFGETMSDLGALPVEAELMLLVLRAGLVGWTAILLRREHAPGPVPSCGAAAWFATVALCAAAAATVRAASLDSARVVQMRVRAKAGIVGRATPIGETLRAAFDRDEWTRPFGLRPVTVVFFSPSCAICAEHAESWAAMEETWRAAGEDFRVVSFGSSDVARSFCDERRIAPGHVAIGDERTAAAYGVDRTPCVLRFAAADTVAWNSESAPLGAPALAAHVALASLRAAAYGEFLRADVAAAAGRQLGAVTATVRPGADSLEFEFLSAGVEVARGRAIDVPAGVTTGVGELLVLACRFEDGTEVFVPLAPLCVYGRAVDLGPACDRLARGERAETALRALGVGGLLGKCAAALQRRLDEMPRRACARAR